MFSRKWLFAAVLITAGSVALATELPFTETGGCMEGPVAQFGRYIGNWKITDSRLARDGSGWSAGAGARWEFVCLGDGVAVQDFWYPNGGNVGTNLRAWNADTESWDIVWAVKPQAGFSHITAKQDDSGNIVMHVTVPLPDPRRRITFFPPDEKGWKWKLEFSSDEGKTWMEVYRIQATPAD